MFQDSQSSLVVVAAIAHGEDFSIYVCEGGSVECYRTPTSLRKLREADAEYHKFLEDVMP